jgi:hypothetical protein
MSDKNSLFDAFKLSLPATDVVPKTETTEDVNKDLEVVDKKKDEVIDTVITPVVEAAKEPVTTEAVEDVTFAPFINHLVDEGVLIKTDKKYDDNEQGFKQIMKDTVDLMFKEKIESLPEDAKRLVELAKEGVDIKAILPLEESIVNLKEVPLDDENSLYNMIIDHLIANGHDEADAVETADTYKDAGIKTLEKHGKVAHKFLLKKQEERLALKIETDKAKVKAVEAARLKEFTDFKSEVLGTEKLGNFELDKKEREALLDYMTKPVKDGKTQSQLDDTPENRLLLAYYRMKGFDMKTIETKVETKVAKKLETALGRFTDKNAEAKQTVANPRQETKEVVKLPTFWDFK